MNFVPLRPRPVMKKVLGMIFTTVFGDDCMACWPWGRLACAAQASCNTRAQTSAIAAIQSAETPAPVGRFRPERAMRSACV